jgi:hypothetical protein
MARHALFNQFTRTIRIAWLAEQNELSTGEALERVMEARGQAERRRSRREFLGDIARVAASLAAAAGPTRSAMQSHAAAAAASRLSVQAWRASRAPIT